MQYDLQNQHGQSRFLIHISILKPSIEARCYIFSVQEHMGQSI